MSLEKRRHGPRIDGILVRSERKRQRERELDAELETYMTMGEPSLVSSPERVESGEIIDMSEEIRLEEVRRELHGRSCDIAKRRAQAINTLLTEQEVSSVTKVDIGFIERHFDRIQKFAKTLRNKGALRPETQRLLHL